MLRKSVFVIVSVILATSLALGDEVGLVVYRDSSGVLTEQSRKNLRSLVRKANYDGTITVWVVFNMPFQADPMLRSPEIVAAESEAKKAAYAAHIVPLINHGLAYELDANSELLIEAPGTMLSVRAGGLQLLARNPSIKHIGHLIGETR